MSVIAKSTDLSRSVVWLESTAALFHSYKNFILWLLLSWRRLLHLLSIKLIIIILFHSMIHNKKQAEYLPTSITTTSIRSCLKSWIGACLFERARFSTQKIHVLAPCLVGYDPTTSALYIWVLYQLSYRLPRIPWILRWSLNSKEPLYALNEPHRKMTVGKVYKIELCNGLFTLKSWNTELGASGLAQYRYKILRCTSEQGILTLIC